MNFDLYKQFMEELAMESGKLIQKYYLDTTVKVKSKRDASPVTIADTEAEALMRDMIRKRFPHHGIIGEEYGTENEEAEFVWVLDPIDGTISFSTGVPLFATLLALLYEGEPIVGAIHQPVLKQYCVGDGKVTTVNQKPVRLKNTQYLSDAMLLTTCIKNIQKHHNFEAFHNLVGKVRNFRTWGDAYGYLLVASGWADAMIDPIMNPWDIAPLTPIIEGAGGVISDWQGNRATLGTSCVVSASSIHQEIIEILNET